jgi:hypothetical protein
MKKVRDYASAVAADDSRAVMEAVKAAKQSSKSKPDLNAKQLSKTH